MSDLKMGFRWFGEKDTPSPYSKFVRFPVRNKLSVRFSMFR